MRFSAHSADGRRHPTSFAAPFIGIAIAALIAIPAHAAPVDTAADADAVPASTEEIPSAAAAQQYEQDNFATPSSAPAAEPGSAEVARYRQAQSGISNAQQLRDLSDFMNDGEITSPIGLGLREARRKLATGEEIDGLLIVEVSEGSPAAGAGLHAYSHKAKDAISALAMLASMAVMPPAVLLIPIIDAVPVGESYDLIIGVDGARVRNFLDFQERTQYLKPGETVYLSVMRDGRRLQFRVPVPRDTALAVF
jgi:hypothetical protein